MATLQEVRQQAQSLPDADRTPASSTAAAQAGTTLARTFSATAVTNIRRKWMAYQPSFWAPLLLWVIIFIIMTVLLMALALSAAGQLFNTAATSVQSSAASWQTTASVRAAAYRSAAPALTITTKRGAAAVRLRTEHAVGTVLLTLGLVSASLTAVAKTFCRAVAMLAVLCWQRFRSLVDSAIREAINFGSLLTASCAAAVSCTSRNLAVLAVRSMTFSIASAERLSRTATSCSSAVATSTYSAWFQVRSRTIVMWPTLRLHSDSLAHTILTVATIQTCVALLARQTFLPGGNLVVALYASSLLADTMSTASMPELYSRVAAVSAAASAMLSSAAHGVQSATADDGHSLAHVSHRVFTSCVPACTSAHTAIVHLTTRAETLWPGCLFMAPLLLVAIATLGLAGHALCLLMPPAAMTAVVLYTTAWLTVPTQVGAHAPVMVMAHATARLVCKGLGLPASQSPQATANTAADMSASPSSVVSSIREQEQFKVWHNPMYGRGGSIRSWSSLSYSSVSPTSPVAASFSWPDVSSPLAPSAVPTSPLSSAPLTEHGMLTQDGQEEELCDEAVEDLVGDSSSLLGSQVTPRIHLGVKTQYCQQQGASAVFFCDSGALESPRAPSSPHFCPACSCFVMRGEQPEEVALSTAESDHDHVSQVSAMTAGSQSVQDMDAPTASGNPWSSSPMRSEVMTNEHLDQAAHKEGEYDEHHVSEVSATTAGAQGVLDVQQTKPYDNPCSSPVLQEAGSSFQAMQPQTAPLASASLTATAGAEVQVAPNDAADLLEGQGADAVRDPWGQSWGWSDPCDSPASHRALHQAPAADSEKYSSQAMSDEQSDEAALRAVEIVEDQGSEVADMTAGTQGILNMHSPDGSDDPWSSPMSQEAGSAFQAMQPQTVPLASLTATAEAEVQVASNLAANALKGQGADAVRSPQGQDWGWGDPWNSPASHSGKRELYQPPAAAADSLEYSSQVMSGKGSSQTMLKTDKIAKDHMTKGSAITSGSYNAWDMVAITPSDNPWSSSPMAQEVTRGEESNWAAPRKAESDDGNVSEVSATAAGAHSGWGMLDNAATAPIDNPWSSTVLQKVTRGEESNWAALKKAESDDDNVSATAAGAYSGWGVLDNPATVPSDDPWSSPGWHKAGRRSQALQPQSALVPSAVALEARLQAVSAEKGQLQQQLTSTLRLLQKARTDLWTSQDAFSELERQSAYEYWTSRPSLRPQGDCSSLLPAHTSRLASPEQDLWARRRYKASTGQDKVGDWQWVMSDFSSTAQVLAPSEAGAAIFGTGANGRVFCGKLVLDGNQVVPAAFKRVAFDTAAQRTKAKAELAALKDLADGPHSLQCYGAFDYRCPQDGKRYLQIAMECVHGISYRELSLPVLESRSADMRYTFGITVLKRMLEALSWPHAQGRAHCDLKTDNMAFCMDGETGELSRIQLMDQGASIKPVWQSPTRFRIQQADSFPRGCSWHAGGQLCAH
ncbi:hypothetical protein ABBQ38_004696 [Trebouxia sp. C0009 RCD-2024]